MKKLVNVSAIALMTLVTGTIEASSRNTHDWASSPHVIAFSYADRTKFDGDNPSIAFTCQEVGKEIGISMELDRKLPDPKLAEGDSDYFDGPVTLFDTDNPSVRLSLDLAVVRLTRDEISAIDSGTQAVLEIMKLFSRAPNSVALVIASEQHDISARGFTRHYREFLKQCRIR